MMWYHIVIKRSEERHVASQAASAAKRNGEGNMWRAYVANGYRRWHVAAAATSVVARDNSWPAAHRSAYRMA